LNDGAPSPTLAKVLAGLEPDPELMSLPAPPRRDRTLAVALMALTAFASLAMCWALRTEVKYAFARPVPFDIGDLATVQPDSLGPNSYVEAHGLLGTQGAIRYARPLEGDSFRLQPVAGQPSVWVEIRVPEGLEGPRFIPPTSFAGRLVPLSAAGLRHSGLARSVAAQTGASVPTNAWLLVDGASPRASRWAVALVALFGFFALWNVANIGRVLWPVRDR
jgi:hypothetical protein